MLRRLMRCVALSMAFGAAAAQAQGAVVVDPELEGMRDRLATVFPDVQREDIQRSAATGLFEVRSDLSFGYVTADGRYLVSGDVMDLATGDHITEGRRNQQRLDIVGRFGDQVIEFAPPAGKLRWWISVFTDVDCEYCRLLHQQVPALNKLGVGVRYLFFSKYGLPSEPFDRAQYIWCQPDPREALDTGLRTGSVKPVTPICANPVRDQYRAAVAMNLRGTPATIMPDGSVFYGYASAPKLLQELQQRPAGAKAAAPPPAAAESP